jgi:hypothetical protein
VRALDPRVIDAVFTAVEGLLPPRPVDDHPLGCHRPRIADKVCFTGIVYRLALGCSWVDAGRLVGVGQATLRRRRDEWIAAGIFDVLAEEAIAGYDRIRGLDLSEVSVDGSIHKAPCGGQGTGPNPTDRAKKGWKWSLASEAAGIPIGWAIEGANRHDLRLFGPTLDAVAARGLDLDIGTSTAATTPTPCAASLPTGTSMTRSSPADADPANPKPLGSGHYCSDCAGRSNGPTPGCPTRASSVAIPTAAPLIGSRSSLSPSC